MTKIAEVVNSYVKYEDGTRDQITSFERAESVAARLSAEQPDKVWLPVDRGQWTSPRYTVIEFTFKVGDEVSMGFNGDYYPQGKIAKIAKNYRIVTLENGKRFFRRKLSESWKHEGTWGLVHGIRNEWNPEF